MEKNKQKNQKGRHILKLGTKPLLAVMALMLIGAAVTSGVLMQYYAQQTSDISITESLLTWDEQPAEQLETTENMNTMPGSETTFYHWLNLSSQATENKTIKFTITDTGSENAEGINMTLYYNDTGTWTKLLDEQDGTTTYEMQPGENLEIKTQYIMDEYLIQSNNYQYTLVIEKNTT